MKKILLFLAVAFLFSGCGAILPKEKMVKPVIVYNYLLPWELNYIPYKLNDTISFTNQTTGKVLHFKCVNEGKSMGSIADTSAYLCDPNTDNSGCNPIVEVYQQYEVSLNCAEDSTYNFRLGVDFNSTYFHISTKTNSYTFQLNEGLYMCGDCAMGNDTLNTECSEWRCYSTLNINGVTYSNVGSNVYYGQAYNPQGDSLGYLYYNQQNGILKFFNMPNEIWNKNHN